LLLQLVICVLCVMGWVCRPSCLRGVKPVKHVSFQEQKDEYVIYGTLRCGYTVKMIKHLDIIGKQYKFVDVSKKENEIMYEHVLNHFGVKRGGVPFTVHIPSDTYFIGFKKITQ
jgi:hypothetical protein